MSEKPRLVVILGPTAVGKTKVATHLAAQVDGEIISADSRQVYRQLDIGTGKDLADYVVGDLVIPHHLINSCEPNEEYNLQHFQQDFDQAYLDILSRSKLPILCGGTGLYIQAVLENYRLTSIPNNAPLRKELSKYTNQELKHKISDYYFPDGFQPDISSDKRLIRAIEIGEFLKTNAIEIGARQDRKALIIGLDINRELRRKLITKRLEDRLNNGLIEEVQSLIASGITKDRLRYFGLEYKFITDHLDGLIDRKTLFDRLNVAIHQFAKRQMTWFRKMERQGHQIHWIDAQLPLDQKVAGIVDKFGGKVE